jgi:hypothetical protein
LIIRRQRNSFIKSNLQEWNGQFWVSCTLAQIGLVYQLGHGGFPCPFPDSTVRKLVVMEAPIIHEIRVSYCKCAKSDDADNLQQLLRNAWYPATVTDPGTCATFRSLESYRLYNVLGNMNVRDYITSLERMTDPSATSGMTWLPVRYRSDILSMKLTTRRNATSNSNEWHDNGPF